MNTPFQSARAILGLLLTATIAVGQQASSRPWRELPLIQDGRVHPSWIHVGWGTFAVDGDSLRTDCDPRGMGLLVYRPEKFGNCQIRVVYRTEHARSNAGVYVRVDDGILQAQPQRPVERDPQGKLSEEMLTRLKQASEAEEGAWYAVHHGYEVQICDDAGPLHRTGAVYSLSRAEAVKAPPTQWKTMIITLKGSQVLVEIDGQMISRFDSQSAELPPRREWYEPKRKPRRPEAGYIGLQNHDPGDVVWFKQVSVRPLE